MRLELRKGERWQSSRLENAGFAFCGGMCSEPEAPDYSGIAAANEASAKLSKEAADNQLAFSKEQYDFLKPYIQKQLQTGQDVAAQQQTDAAKASEVPKAVLVVVDAAGQTFLNDHPVSLDELARGEFHLSTLREREARCAASDDLREGREAMAQKRPARFTGR